MICRKIGDTSLYVGERTQKMNAAEMYLWLTSIRPALVVNLWHTADTRLLPHVPDYMHESIPDGRLRPDAAQVVEHLALRVAEVARTGENVYLHCYGGRNRSALVAAVALVRYRKMEPQAAIDVIRAARKSALANEHFVDYIKSLREGEY